MNLHIAVGHWLSVTFKLRLVCCVEKVMLVSARRGGYTADAPSFSPVNHLESQWKISS